jgi:hypothetical protein
MQKRNLAIRLNLQQHLTQPLSLYQHLNLAPNGTYLAPIFLETQKELHFHVTLNNILSNTALGPISAGIS